MRKRRLNRYRAAALVAVLLGSGCRGHSGVAVQHRGPTDEAFVRELLESWLVRRDLDAARGYLATDFFLVSELRDRAAWPEALQSLPDAERALRFPFECTGAPSLCRSLDDCVESFEHRAGGFEIEPWKVDAKGIEAQPDLRSREGRELALVTFNLKGCNLGTSLLIDKEAPDDRRVVSILYIAG